MSFLRNTRKKNNRRKTLKKNRGGARESQPKIKAAKSVSKRETKKQSEDTSTRTSRKQPTESKKSKKSKREVTRSPQGSPIVSVEIINVDNTIDKIETMEELVSVNAKKGFRNIFGYETKGTFTYGNGYQKVFENARDWLEPTNPTTQCTAVIGHWEDRRDTELCYLCGIPLTQDDIEEFPPECEHILPVFQACCFLELYTTKLGSEPTEQDYQNMSENEASRIRSSWKLVKQEYLWSHRCCNQIKSNNSFMNYNPKDGFVFDKLMFKKIMTGIFNGKMADKEGGKKEIRDYCGSLTGKFTGSIKDWLTQRENVIRKIIENITKSLNKVNRQETRGLFYLSVLSSLISAVDSKYRNAVNAQRSGVVFKPPHVNESIRKAAIYMNISKQISDLILRQTWNLDTYSVDNIRTRNDFVFIMNGIFSPSLKNYDNILYIEKRAVSYEKVLSFITSQFVAGYVSTKNDSKNDFYFNGFYRDIYSLLPVLTITDEKVKHDISEKGLQIISYLSLLKNANILVGYKQENQNSIQSIISFFQGQIRDFFTGIDNSTKYLLVALIIRNDQELYNLMKMVGIEMDNAAIQNSMQLIDNNRVETINSYYIEMKEIDPSVLVDDTANLTHISVDSLSYLRDNDSITESDMQHFIDYQTDSRPDESIFVFTQSDDTSKELKDNLNETRSKIEQEVADSLMDLSNSSDDVELNDAANTLFNFTNRK